MEQLGYHIIYFDLDTEDTVYSGSAEVPISIFDRSLASTSRLVISHDIQPQTATVLTEHMLKGIQAAGLKAVTVGECLNEPPENWYRLSNGVPFVPPNSWTKFVMPEAPLAKPNSVANPDNIASPSSALPVEPSKLSTTPITSITSASASASISSSSQSSTKSKPASYGASRTSSTQVPPSSLATSGSATSAAKAIGLSQLSAIGTWLLFIGSIVNYCS
jgi:hypothetical protein